MGRYLRKSNGIGEAAAAMEAAEDGVRITRGRDVDADVAAEPVVVKKRRVAEEEELKPPSPAPALEKTDTESVLPENLVSPKRPPVLSPSSDHAQASCCSSNDSSELTKETFKFVDLEEENADMSEIANNSECAESGQKTPLKELETEPGELESTAMLSEELNSLLKPNLEKTIMIPSSGAQLEDFFTIAERKIQKEFSEKYNFDFLNEKPMEGRYEWAELLQP